MTIPDKTLIYVFGPICSGKSTVVSALMRKHRGIYCVDFDMIKLQLSGYYWKDDKEFATKLTCDFLNLVVNTGRPIICMLSQPRSAAQYESYIGYAEERGYRVAGIYLTAPKEVLDERYKERLKHATRKIRTLEEFYEALEDKIYKPEGALELDSSRLSTNELLDRIEAHSF